MRAALPVPILLSATIYAEQLEFDNPSVLGTSLIEEA
jgi:hypothetical protein